MVTFMIIGLVAGVSGFFHKQRIWLWLIALGSFALYFGGLLIGSLPFVIFTLGCLFVGLEFYLPGTTIAGLVGAIAVWSAFYLHLQSAMEASLMTLICLVATVIVGAVWLSRGYSLMVNPLFVLQQESNATLPKVVDNLLGAEVIAHGDLKPMGNVLWQERLIQVKSLSGFIAEGTTVVVTAKEGQLYLVKEKKYDEITD